MVTFAHDDLKDDELVTTFAENLRRFREARGLSKTELANAAGLNKMAITRYEKAERTPVWPAVVRLAHALGCSTDDFEEPVTERKLKRMSRV